MTGYYLVEWISIFVFLYLKRDILKREKRYCVIWIDEVNVEMILMDAGQTHKKTNTVCS